MTMGKLCGCAQCATTRLDMERLTQFIVCEICGNKRCPHATDHRHECTKSNKYGQSGSYYGDHVVAYPEGYNEALARHMERLITSLITMAERDPRVTPVVGDVLETTVERRRVDGWYTPKVFFLTTRLGGKRKAPTRDGECTFVAWRAWAKTATIIKRGDS
jgi:hypothetical protein